MKRCSTQSCLTMSLAKVFEDVFVVEKEIEFAGMLVPARTTILFTNSHCVIYSPLDAPHAYAALTSMVGNRQVVIVAPNGMHHMFLDKCRQLFPSAIVISSPCLKQRFPERDFGRTLNDVHGAPLIDGLDDVLAWLVPTKGTLNEIVLLHKPSHTLVLCDWAFNLRFVEVYVPERLHSFIRNRPHHSDSLVSKMPWFGRIYLYLALRRQGNEI